MPIILGVETLTLPDGTEVDVRIGLGLSIDGYRPPADVTQPQFITGTLTMGTGLVTLYFNEPVTWPGVVPAGFYFEYEGSYWWADPPGGGDGGTLITPMGKGTATITLQLQQTFPIYPDDPLIFGHIGYIGGPGSLTGDVTDLAGNALGTFPEEQLGNIGP
jgi:hypothetical protein